MAFSKVTLNGVTLMDVTQDTVEAGVLLANYTATDAAGLQITGTLLDGDSLAYGSVASPTVGAGTADNMVLAS